MLMGDAVSASHVVSLSLVVEIIPHAAACFALLAGNM